MTDKPVRRRRKEARPAEIIEAALATFAERGFAATRLEEVARCAGVGKGTLYLYFPSKQALFEAVVRETLLPAIGETETATATYPGSTADLMRLLFRRFAHLMARTPLGALPKIVLAEAGNFPEMAAFYRREVIERGIQAVRGILGRGVERGEFRPVEVDRAGFALIAPVLFLALWKHSFDPLEDAPLDPEAFLDLAVDLMLAGLLRREKEPAQGADNAS